MASGLCPCNQTNQWYTDPANQGTKEDRMIKNKDGIVKGNFVKFDIGDLELTP